MINAKRLLVTTLCITAIGLNTEIKAQKNSTKWDLDSCINYAMQQNINIRKNKITAESSNIDVKTAKAALFPSLSFSSSQNYVNRQLIIDSNQKKNSYNANYGLNASWTVYNGGQNLKTIKQEQVYNKIDELNVEASKNEIETNIAQAYIQILYAAESVKINENTLKISEAQRDRGKELLKAGSIAQSDYAQLESQCSTDKYQLVTSQATLQNYKLQLKQLLELDGEEEMDISMPTLNDSDVLTLLPTKTDVYKAALALRPEIKASKLSVQNSELAIKIARAGYLPTLTLTAGTGTSHTSGSSYTFEQQVKNGWNNSVGVTLSVPIFSNRKNKSAVEKAKLQYTTSQLNMLDEEKALFKTIEGYWLDANSAQQSYMAANEKLRSTQISYDLISQQFNLGMKNTVELLTEKNNLLAAKQQTLQAKYMAILNALLLRFYQGESIKL
ncbi:TolC family protein [uncultured Bacteroides sp.]|uniref:TolC family protein n=1 Tax=uncultured Bacteroides sp. TaxID=162156 RepID=UPI002AAB460B|nr:TolC family protein [uncultured Bacteroides sp.]